MHSKYLKTIILSLLLLIGFNANARTNKHHGNSGQQLASWYGPGFHGKRTASGERFNTHALTAAHKTLKLGTRVRVTNLNNNKSVIVVINDRGPYVRGRVIDLSMAAKNHLSMGGVAPVKLEVIN